MNLLDMHRSALRRFDNGVRAIRADQWPLSTPDAEWTVLDLVGHLVAEQLWVPFLLDGGTVTEAGHRFEGDQLGSDPKAAWATASTAARAAWTAAGALDRTVHLSHGDVPAEEYCRQQVTDLTVHAWDLARAIGVDDEMPNDLLAAVLDHLKPTMADRQGSGLFAPSIPVPGCTDDLTELLALTGRHRWWRRAA